MNIALRPLLALPAAILLLAACDHMPAQPELPSTDTPTFNASLSAPADRYVEENLFDLTDSVVTITCEDGSQSEDVRLEGKIYERNVLMFTPAGGINYTLQTMPVGLRGFGLSSGEEYRVSERQQIASSNTTMGATGSYRQEVKFFSKDSRARFRMVVLGHYRFNSNYEFVVDRETIRYECSN